MIAFGFGVAFSGKRGKKYRGEGDEGAACRGRCWTMMGDGSRGSLGSGSRSCRIVCVGDVHDQWGKEDGLALARLDPDLVLFVGDYGNENVECVRMAVREVDQLGMSAAFAFGNHDAWYTATYVGRRNCPYDRSKGDRVLEMIDVVGDRHAGYRALPFQDIKVSVVGGRPFSWGGPYWKHPDFFRQYAKVGSLEHSMLKIRQGVEAVDSSHSIVFLAHNGPTGLGDDPADPCGRDFGMQPGGDFGDADLRDGIDFARAQGRSVPLVVFGHMHKILEHGQGYRRMVMEEQGTVMVNAAVVPRIINGMRAFTLVEIGDSMKVDSVSEVWVGTSNERMDKTTIYQRCSNEAASKGILTP